MNFKYFKIILSFGFSVMNGVLAMENSSNDMQSFSRSLPQLTFDSVQTDYKQFLDKQDPTLKIKIISDLNVLLRRGKIDANNKPNALEIAQRLKAGNLENSINFYQNIKFIKKNHKISAFLRSFSRNCSVCPRSLVHLLRCSVRLRTCPKNC